MENKFQKNMGSNAQSKKEGVAHKVGDAIERVGDKISNAGATKVGNAIHRAGDKIEHSRDNKKNQ